MSELGMAKVRGVFRRRKIPIIATAVGVLGVAAALIYQVEPGYKASAVIRVAEVQPAKEYVAPTVAEQIGERLKSLRLAIMARPIVLEAANATGLIRDPKRADEVVDDIKARMDVKVEGEDTFLLTYADPNPEKAKAVVNKVSEIFMKRHVERREQVASATVTAFKTQLESLQPQLEAADKAVREFKTKHYGSLPEQQESNLRTLDQTTMEVNIQSTNLDMDNERRRQLMAAAMSPLRHHEETLAGALYEARTKYTPDNPEVKKIQAEYEQVHGQRLEDERGLNDKVRRNNPEVMALEGEIGRTKAMLAGLRSRQADVRTRVDQTAKNGQELAGLQSTYDGLKEKYNLTLSHVRDAELAAGLEKGLASMRFDLVEGATVPQHAMSPNRPLLGLGAILLALALALGMGFALDANDSSIRDPDQLRDVTVTTPILAVIPKVDLPKGSYLNTHGPKAEA
ncbi:MAG: Chain length determinant family protein [bacterium]|nr:Chain length determinant family protein [bacterium]